MSWRRIVRGRNTVTLTDYKLNVKDGSSRSVFQVRHSSSVLGTVLEQNVIIDCDEFGRVKPTVELNDFPQGIGERETMLKLADWLHRLSVSIEDHWSQK